MSKKDYVLIAQILNCYVWNHQGEDKPQQMLKAIAESLAEAFKQKNDRFDRIRFMEAVFKK